DIVVEIAAEGIVRVLSKGPDGRWKCRDERPVNPAFLGRGISYLRLVHAVFPIEILRHVGWLSEGEVVAEGKPVFPFLLIAQIRFELALQQFLFLPFRGGDL